MNRNRAGVGAGASRKAALAGMASMAFPATALLILSGCLFQNEKSPVAQGTGVRGSLVDSSGRPLRGARVRAMPVETFRLAKASHARAQDGPDTIATDATGRYAFPDLASGDYNLLAEYGQGELAALVPDVRYRDSAGLLELGQDTLETPGAIQGRVLRNGKGYEGAVAYLPGTSFLAVSDSTGAFQAVAIPAGTYSVNYLVPGFRASRDTGVRVHPGRITRLADKALANDTTLPPPPPSAPVARLDTARGRVRLTWRPVDVEDILGYLVYRDTGGGSSPVLLNDRILTDSAFVDSLPDSFWSNGDTIDVRYRLRSIDKGKNISSSYSPPATVRAPPRSRLTTTLALAWIGAVGNRVAMGDSLGADLTFDNPSLPYLEVAWTRSDDTSWIQKDTLLVRSGRLQRNFTFRTPGIHVVRVKAVGPENEGVGAAAGIDAVTGLPWIEAGSYPMVSIGDPLELAGEDDSDFGVVVKREWDIGGHGVFAATGSGRILIAAPLAESTLICIYRVTDDKGRQAVDTATIVVVADPPWASLYGPLQVFQGDTIRLSIDALKDKFGSVVETAWDIGGKGEFIRTTSPDTSFVAGSADSVVPCILRVTDDDGQIFRIEHRILVKPRKDWIKVSDSSPFNSLDFLYAWEYDGRLWISDWNPLIPRHPGSPSMGAVYSADLIHWKSTSFPRTWSTGQPPQPTPIRAEGGRIWGVQEGVSGLQLFSSTDGMKWDTVAVPAGLSDMEYHVAQPFQGDLFVMGSFEPRIGQRVWATRGGTGFFPVTDKAAFGQRSLMTTALMSGKMWLYGGLVENGVSNEVWSSSDGIAWARESDSALGQPLHMATMAAYQNELWILGGEANLGGRSRDIWRSPNGRAWTRDTLQTPLLGGNTVRTSLVPFKGRLLLVAVHPDREGVTRTEIWMAP